MKIKSASRPAFFNLRVLIGFGLCAVGLLPASAQIGGGGTADYVPLWLDSSTLGDSSIHQSPSGYIGIGTQLPIAALGVVNVHGARAIHGSTRGNFTAVEGLNLSSTGANAVGVAGDTTSSAGQGVLGSATSSSGQAYGVEGFTLSPLGAGVFGTVTGADSQGVYGLNQSTTGLATGVKGVSASGAGNAVLGINTAATGTATGVTGETSSSAGQGVFGLATSTATGTAYGVYGQSANGIGVYGITTSNTSFPSVGVRGVANANNVSCCTNGVEGINLSTAGNNNGVFGTTPSSGGVGGIFENTGGGLSILARVNASQNSFWVDGTGSGFFAGNLTVTGAITAGTKDFKIDHPLDPANKYLYHTSVESPDMLNIYNGNITTDENGSATVELPNYFEALNRDFRYQLTVIGQFAQAVVAEEISHNRFTIRTSQPSVKVSWQVTGIRQDAWANAHRSPAEEDKPAEERGTYLHPELYGASADKNKDAIAQH